MLSIGVCSRVPAFPLVIMRETIYLQAGPVSNLIGAHFFATQFSYYPLDESDESAIDLETCFRAVGTSNPTPRAVVFDFRDNFRGIPVADIEDNDAEEETQELTWQGRVDKHPRPQASIKEPSVWSDVPVDYAPNALFPIANMSSHPSWDTSDPEKGNPALGWGDFSSSRERYRALREDAMERIRSMTEECDLPQGVQAGFDSPSFGAFNCDLLSDVRDDLGHKLPILAVPIMSSSSCSPSLDLITEAPTCRRILNDALVLSELAGGDEPLASLLVPIQSPAIWKIRDLQQSGFNYSDTSGLYESTAMLSSQLESATLPTRLAGSARFDLRALSGQLNWRSNTIVASLAGSVSPQGQKERPIYDFSAGSPVKPNAIRPYAAHFVLRGIPQTAREAVELSIARSVNGLESPLLQVHHTLAYPLHTSFPAGVLGSGAVEADLVTALCTSVSPAAKFESLAQFVDRCVRVRVSPIALGLGDEMDLDLLKEATERLWTMRDGFAEDDG
ncbi:hypothetical protein BKA62DRAFT_242755 [Auriculariales sp. MPI-PUGE-AT-0066]|nr:hypothetical protein BKA62DRAFT_242755 [Auriculariales sp. MPI-PUGE-AT-0066]